MLDCAPHHEYLTNSEWNEYDQLAKMLGTGAGLQRVPAKTSAAYGVMYKTESSGVVVQSVTTSTALGIESEWARGREFDPRGRPYAVAQRITKLIEYHGEGGASLETSVGDYRFQATRKAELDGKLRKKSWQGWRLPVARDPYPSSPFGREKFRPTIAESAYEQIIAQTTAPSFFARIAYS